MPNIDKRIRDIIRMEPATLKGPFWVTDSGPHYCWTTRTTVKVLQVRDDGPGRCMARPKTDSVILTTSRDRAGYVAIVEKLDEINEQRIL